MPDRAAAAIIDRWVQDTLTLLASLAVGEPAELAAVVQTLDSIRDTLPAVVSAMREHGASLPERHGRPYTWQELADALGVSRQAATERFGRGLR